MSKEDFVDAKFLYMNAGKPPAPTVNSDADKIHQQHEASSEPPPALQQHQRPVAYEQAYNRENSPTGFRVPAPTQSSHPPPPLPPQPPTNDRLRQLAGRFEIGQDFMAKLMALQGFRIVLLFDDSGSMQSSLFDSPLQRGSSSDGLVTRWDELRSFAEISFQVATVFNSDGTCDVFFLNRPPLRQLRDINALKASFSQLPFGFTPLTRVLSQILNEHGPSPQRLLVMIVTDGEPSDDMGNVDIYGFRQALLSKRENVFVSIVACTDDAATMSYLNNWDREIRNLDVMDDYRSEREEVMRARGPGFRFSYGDYIVKCFAGSVDASLDNLDGF